MIDDGDLHEGAAGHHREQGRQLFVAKRRVGAVSQAAREGTSRPLRGRSYELFSADIGKRLAQCARQLDLLVFRRNERIDQSSREFVEPPPVEFLTGSLDRGNDFRNNALILLNNFCSNEPNQRMVRRYGTALFAF